MKIPSTFVQTTTTTTVSINDMDIELKSTCVLIPDLKHYVAVVYFDIKDEHKPIFDDIATELAGSEIVPLMLHTAFEQNTIPGENGGEDISTLPLYEGAKHLQMEFEDNYAIPTHLRTKDGTMVTNMSTCFLYHDPGCMEMIFDEENSHIEEECVGVVSVPLQGVTQMTIEQALDLHVAKLHEYIHFDMPVPHRINTDIPAGWSNLINAVLNLRDAYLLATYPDKVGGLEVHTRKFDELTDLQKFMVYRSIHEEFEKMVNATDAEPAICSIKNPTVKQKSFYEACMFVYSVNMDVVKTLLLEEQAIRDEMLGMVDELPEQVG